MASYNGKEITHLPYSIEPDVVQPIYTTLKGWQEDLTQMQSADTLPKTMCDYIRFIEDYVEVPIKIVSVGPDRKQTLHR